MAVLAQGQLDPFLSGECFKPVTRADAAVSEYAHDLGVAVAPGAGHPSSLILPRLPGVGFDWGPHGHRTRDAL